MTFSNQESSNNAGRVLPAQQLTAYLHDRDVPCPACGYNLRNLLSARCPECGRDVHLGVKLRHPRMAAWVTLLIILTFGDGIALFLGVILLARQWPAPLPEFPLCYFACAPPATAMILLLRKRCLRIRLGAQWAIAILAAIVSLIMAIVLVSDF